jgi:Highly conserved protein containing a thioredoxin domain
MPNHLASETSPYLLQHADNPVDWHPWGEEALTLARRENKPILLSIGYSACHWCHVMARESFEDEAIAALLNQHFVCIKVDREERPDLDHIYQSTHYLLTQRPGGWPLNMFLSPEQVPFFGGTYFPKDGRTHMTGFRELIPLIARHYHENQARMGDLADSLREALEERPSGGESPSAAPIEAAYRTLERSFDPVHGGFGAAPKFPRPGDLDFLLRRGEEKATAMALHTLRKMAEGGLFDQLGGGFFRYSVDERWAIPHFEKMLYDNGLLLAAYADAWRATGDPLYRQVLEETAGWMLREMRAPEGGFYSALDADSEHEEGKFYVWTRAEFEQSLSPEERPVAEAVFGLDLAPNFEGKAWHPVVARSLGDVARDAGLSPEEVSRRLDASRSKLFTAREQRVRPGRDEKVLTSWNALAIKGLARAGRALGRAEWTEAAGRAAAFMQASLWREGKLLAACKDGQARLPAYLDDYAALLDALLELLQTEFRPDRLAFARELADGLLERFEDQENGGFYFTAHDHEALLARMKPAFDNATPSGNGLAAFALQRLGHVLGEARYLEAAERTLKAFAADMARQPVGCLSLLAALEEWLEPPRLAVLRGPAAEVAEWEKALARDYLPRCLVLPLPNGLDGLPVLLRHPETSTVNAWVCESVKCLPAIEDMASLRQVCKGGKLV